MLKATDSVNIILNNKTMTPAKRRGHGTAPSNIALVKYWGKRNPELNLPNTASLSISLGDKGTITAIEPAEHDCFYLNDKKVGKDTAFHHRLTNYLNLFRQHQHGGFLVNTHSTVPVAAGLASSASGFAALVLALDDLFDWQLPKQQLSLLARLGSGSASRSLWQGFVEWHAGTLDDGMDSFAEPLDANWPELRIGLLIFTEKTKKISSRDAMNITTATSPQYAHWPDQVAEDLVLVKRAIAEKDLSLLGETAERNALMMHQTMLEATPRIDYSSAETHAAREKVRVLRQQGLGVYFTQDAGPNIKLLFLADETDAIQQAFPELIVI